MVFYLPATVPGKVTIGVSMLLSNTVLLLVMASVLPVQSNTTPVLGRSISSKHYLQ